MNEYGDNITNNDFSNMSTRDYLNCMASMSAQNNYYTYETVEPKKPEKPKKYNMKKAKLYLKKGVALTAAAALFGGVAGGVFNLVTENTIEEQRKIIEEVGESVTTEDVVIPATSVKSEGVSDSQSINVADIVDATMPSVVSITIKSVEEYGGFFGYYEYEAEGSGSGIIIGENDTELLIVTNNHVVSDAETVSVTFIDETSYEAKVKGLDSENDLAIIVVELDKLSEETRKSIKIATIGNSDDLRVGEQVIAIGNALGYGQSVTTGIVSAKDRVNTTNSTPLIQTDAAINPGNSGGALLNMNGELVGINSSKYMSTDVEGMGYAIPITQVNYIIDELMNRETREKVSEEKRGYLGISCSTISSDVAAIYGVSAGVLVNEVFEDSAAEEAGIKKNSVITKFDGQSISSVEQLTGMLDYYEIGETVEVCIQIIDDSEVVEKKVKVTLKGADTVENN